MLSEDAHLVNVGTRHAQHAREKAKHHRRGGSIGFDILGGITQNAADNVVRQTGWAAAIAFGRATREVVV